MKHSDFGAMTRLSLRSLVTLIVLTFTSLAAYATTPIIFNHTKSAATGDVIFLQGDSFGTTTKVQYSYNSASWATLTPLTHGNNAVTARLPFLSGKAGQSIRNLVTVRVYNGSAWSQPTFINQAHAMSYDSPEVAAGSPFRIFGRNLFFSQTPPVMPTVRFVDQTSHASLPATVTTTGSTTYVLNVTAPAALVAGDNYDVYVSNGYNGSSAYGTGETKADESLLARNYGVGASDVWNLGVPWGADFSAHFANVYNVQTDSRLTLHAVGDGVNNDQPAIQAALDAARYAGGGVVYLPAGTYKLVFDATQTVGLMMWSNVVLAGAGMNQTTVQYGVPGPNGGQNFGLSLGNGWDTLTGMGVADLTIQNVDTTGQWSDNIFVQSNPYWHNGQVSTELFFQRVKLQAGNGNVLWTGGVTKMAVENSDFEVVGGYTDAWLGAGSNSIFRGNIVHWSGGGAVSFGGVPDILVENNHFIRNCNYSLYPQVANTRCFDTAFNKNLVIQNNLFDVEGGVVNTKENDGETISSEPSNLSLDVDTGTVTSATATTLTDTTKHWTVPNDYRLLTTCFSSVAAVAIVGGKGTGEWQPIVPSTSPNTLTVPAPWTVTPDTTSKYAILDWENENWLISGNTLNNGRVGIQLFFGSSHDTAIVGNTLTDNGGITTLPFEVETAAGQSKMFTPNWDDQMIGNTVTDTKGGYYPDPNLPGVLDGSGPAQIGVQSGAVDAATNLGTSVIGLEIRGNTINGSGTKFQNYQYVSEGYCNYFTYGSDNQTNFTDTSVPILLGTIFQGNAANNCNTGTATSPPYYVSNGAFRLSSGAYQTVLLDNVVGVAGSLVEDDLTLYDNTPNRSVGTYGSTSVGQGNNWLDVDIGSPGLAGSASLSNGVFTVNGGGGWTGGPDQFNFCYQTLTGNGTIIARIKGEGNTGSGGYAGVMIRHTLDPLSMYVDTVLYPNNPTPGSASASYQCRYTDGGGTGNVFAAAAVPYWMKLVRAGDTYTGYTAPDRNGAPGIWKQIWTNTYGSVGPNTYIGLAVTAGNNSLLNTATIDNVTVTSP